MSSSFDKNTNGKAASDENADSAKGPAPTPPVATPEAPPATAAPKDEAPAPEKPAEEAATTEPAKEPEKAPEKPQILCRKKSRKIIHKFALAGTVFAALPIPMATSAGLTAMETYLVYFIGKVYGEDLSYPETMMVASGLNVASVALKTLAREGVGLIPVIGSGIRAAIAAGAIEAIGEAAIRHFEKRHPGKTTNAD